MAYLLIDPHSTLDVEHDWSDYLAEGDTIVSRQWSITPLNPGSPTTPVLTGPTSERVLVSGGLSGYVYHLVERITTAAGIVDDRTEVLRCEDT